MAKLINRIFYINIDTITGNITEYMETCKKQLLGIATDEAQTNVKQFVSDHESMIENLFFPVKGQPTHVTYHEIDLGEKRAPKKAAVAVKEVVDEENKIAYFMDASSLSVDSIQKSINLLKESKQKEVNAIEKALDSELEKIADSSVSNRWAEIAFGSNNFKGGY